MSAFHPYAALRRRCLGTITEFRTTEPVAALTFDDGPDPSVTPRVLELLEAHGARATFFVVGESAAGCLPLIRQMAAAGHALGNHTWSHQAVGTLSRSKRRHEVVSCSRAIAPHGSRLFRPPWGEQTIASRLDAFLLRHEVIAWSVDANDWWNPDAEAMASLLVQRVRPGSVILLHDHIRSVPSTGDTPAVRYDRSSMLAALKLFLERTSGRLNFVTIPEMFHHGKAVRREWFRSRLGPSQVPANAASTARTAIEPSLH